MKFHYDKFSVCRVVSGIFIFAGAGLAQTPTGTISGVVVGDNGAPIPLARVYAGLKPTSQAVKAPPTLVSKVASTVQADAKGAFSMPGLPVDCTCCARRRRVRDGWTLATGRRRHRWRH